MTDETKPPQGTPPAESMALRAADTGMAAAIEMGAHDVLIAVVANDGSFHTRWIGSGLAIRALAEYADKSAREQLPLVSTIGLKKP